MLNVVAVISHNCQKLEIRKCVNCGDEHSANYRGVVVAKELQKLKNKNDCKVKSGNDNQKNIYKMYKINQEKPSFAPETVSRTNSQTKIKPQEYNISQTLQLILNKITS